MEGKAFIVTGTWSRKLANYISPTQDKQSELEVKQSYNFSKPFPRDVLPPAKPFILMAPHSPQIALPVGNQQFKYMSLSRTFVIQVATPLKNYSMILSNF